MLAFFFIFSFISYTLPNVNTEILRLLCCVIRFHATSGVIMSAAGIDLEILFAVWVVMVRISDGLVARK